MTSELSQALKTLEGFNALSESVREELAPFMSTRIVRAGETIFCQGEPSPYCFGVLSGEVVIQHVSKDKRFPPKVLGVIGSGGLFGESALFEESPRAAMASAIQDGVLLTLRGPQLREWILKNPQTAQALLLALLKTSGDRLYRTSHELSVMYGIGRLLGSDKPFLEQFSAALDFLRGSLEGLDDVIFYSRNPFWEEFTPLMASPETTKLIPLPLPHPLIQHLSKEGSVQTCTPMEIRAFIEEFKLPWAEKAAIAILPLFDRDKTSDSLQGLLFLSSARQTEAFSAEKQLLLTALSHPLAEVLSRHSRQEEARAQARLQQSKKPESAGL